jgi:translation elongation factor EF-1alpha
MIIGRVEHGVVQSGHKTIFSPQLYRLHMMKEDIDKKNAQFEALKEKVEREDKELKRT